MPGKTNTEKIDELSRQVASHFPVAEMLFKDLRRDIDALTRRLDEGASLLQSSLLKIAALEQRIVHLEQRALEFAPSRIAVVEQRCAQLEKQSDRRWQVWLAILGSVLALLIALLRK